MRINYFMDRIANLKLENRMLKFFVAVVGLASVFSSYFAYRALEYQRVVLVPMTLGKEVTIWGSGAEAEYIAEFSRYISLLLLTTTPETVEGNYAEVLKYVDPEVYPDMEEKMVYLVDILKSARVCSAFYPSSFEVKKEGDRYIVKVKGKLIRRAEGEVIESNLREFSLTLKVRSGLVSILELPLDEIGKIKKS